MIFLETGRLILRNVEAQDGTVMFDYRNHPSCAQYQRGQQRARNQIDQVLVWHRQDRLSTESDCLMALTLRETGEMVGEIVVMPTQGTFSLGYTIHYRHQRKGYAFEALSALTEHLHRHWPHWEQICFVHPENLASMGLLQKLGYEDVGYIPAMESRVFGKWVHPATLQDVAQAAVMR